MGRALDQACYVEDYVDFWFEGAILRALTTPEVDLPRGSSHAPDKSESSPIQSLIGASVAGVVIRERQECVVTFTNGARLRIPLDASARVGPEAMHFLPVKGGPLYEW